MGIYIEKMSKPLQCISCPMWTLTYIHARNAVDICNLEKRPVEPYHVPKWCPLKQLPPHGKLIDADALKMRTGIGYGQFGCQKIEEEYQYVSDTDIKRAPTIIPADEGE